MRSEKKQKQIGTLKEIYTEMVDKEQIRVGFQYTPLEVHNLFALAKS